ncbi:MAG: zinc-binding dehydrogenase [Hespellia sp.]|nr:zinc-binding dehydrogenase [Hespellia sp.]
MDMNSTNIEEIVKQVLSNMTGGASQTAAPAASAPKAQGNIPATARVAMLTELEHYEIKEFPMPEVGDDDILVKVEGCGICGTDAHEFKRDPFSLIPVALGHEGTGEIVKMGKNVTKDSAGKPVTIGDKVVTCMIFADDPDITMYDLNKQNVGAASVYGLLPDDDVHLNGWFSDYILIRGGSFGSTFFNVSDLDLESRILIEPCAVLIHAVERAKTTGILRFNSRVVVQGCGPIGLICIAVLRTMGIENIVAVDGNAQRLEFAKKMGAEKSVNFMDHKGIEALTAGVKDAFGGNLADFAFQCTGNPMAHANIYKFIRNGGGLCELGFFINGGDATINPHFDICSKEITTVGSWVYTLRDYATTFDFLKRSQAIGLPMKELITDKFPLEQINEAHQTNLAMTGLKIAIINK